MSWLWIHLKGAYITFWIYYDQLWSRWKIEFLQRFISKQVWYQEPSSDMGSGRRQPRTHWFLENLDQQGKNTCLCTTQSYEHFPYVSVWGVGGSFMNSPLPPIEPIEPFLTGVACSVFGKKRIKYCKWKNAGKSTAVSNVELIWFLPRSPMRTIFPPPASCTGAKGWVVVCPLQ